MRFFFAVILFSYLAGTVLSHPQRYPKSELPKSLPADGSLPPFRSYHIHVLFLMHNNNSCTGVDNAMLLRQRFMTVFNLSDSLPCEADFDQGRLCPFPIAYGPYGPWVVPEFAFFVPLELFGETVPWIMQNRGEFDIMVHPNSGFEHEDHAKWAIWGGTPWRLDLSDPEFTEALPPYPLPWQQGCQGYEY